MRQEPKINHRNAAFSDGRGANRGAMRRRRRRRTREKNMTIREVARGVSGTRRLYTFVGERIEEFEKRVARYMRCGRGCVQNAPTWSP